MSDSVKSHSLVRFKAATVVEMVLGGSSLTDSLKKEETDLNSRDIPLLRSLSYGCVRHFFSLSFLLEALLVKPLRPKDKFLKALLLLGLYQVFHTRVPEHAVVSECVHAAVMGGAQWAKGLVNAVLRNALRQKESLCRKLDLASEDVKYNFPGWLLARLKNDWPEQYRNIMAASNDQAPMTLRVNSARTTRAEYEKNLEEENIEFLSCKYSKDAVSLLEALNVERLPGFFSGLVSVQDEAAQLSAGFLQCKNGMTVLDACAAPGGKACHLLENTPGIKLDVLDNNKRRLQKVTDNFERLTLSADLICGNALKPSEWWNGQKYDRILLDAPCSASGVIRRHSDIKLLRRKVDIENLAQLQKDMLASLWALLKRGGMLLYATCSVLKEENSKQIQEFLAHHRDAALKEIKLPVGTDTGFGVQLFPEPGGHDGFFYSLLVKI